MSYSTQERAYFDQLFAAVDKQDSGVLAGQDALPLLMSANLPQQTLGEIWALADPDNNGFLTRDAWYKAARMVGWLQKGGKTSVGESLASQSGPLPTFQGQAPPPVTPQATGMSAMATGPRLPPLTPADRAKFTKIFVGCGPANGLVTGDKARDVFLKSQLDYDKLGQIWNLADTQGRGSLDLVDFIIGMYLIQSCMANPSLTLPAVLPPGTYEAASGGRGPASPIARQNTGPTSPIRAQYTGNQRGATWDVTTEAKNTSDRFFMQLDTQNRGFIEGDVAVPFMLQSQLDEGTLASIWDLADIRKEGKLNKDEFAVAMHLINAKLAGRDPPTSLPTSLVPPSLRNEVVQPPQTSAAKDLFDLFADEPITAPTPSFPMPQVASPVMSPRVASPHIPVRSPMAASPQMVPPTIKSPPPADLMGEEDQPIADNSAEIGNKRNQLENTNRGLESMEKERPGLEKAAASGANELKDLEEKLAAARSKHEAESKAVADLKSRVSEQKEKIQSVNMDYIAAQSDVSALQSERDELEQALLAGKEEVRDLNKRMKEIAQEKSGLLLLLEKLKKETRQQKGMVSIAKKQLATAEGGRDSVQGEVRELEREDVTPQAAAVPLPSTPRALSPATTGSRSNNPFDRFREGAKSPAGSFGAGALIGAAAGVVAAGAETLYEAAKDVVSPTGEPAPPAEKADFDSAFAEFDGQEGLPSGIPKSAVPYLSENERTASTLAVQGSMPDSPASTVPGVGESSLRNAAEDSSDEDEGPEDVEAIKYQSKPDNTPILYPPVSAPPAEEAPKPRRSAPPPPPRTVAAVDDLDPFGNEQGQISKEPEALPASAAFDPFGVETRADGPLLDDPAPRVAATEVDSIGAPQTGKVDHETDPFGAPQGDVIDREFESSGGVPGNKEESDLGRPDIQAKDDPSTFDAQGDDKPKFDPFGASHGQDAKQQADTDSAPQASDPFGAPLQGTAAPTQLGFEDDEFMRQQSATKAPFEAPKTVPFASFDDAFGTAESTDNAPAQAAAKGGFDDDDFDFSDAPPVQMTQTAKAAPKDDFDFDDEFEQPSNSDGSKSYEMVSPPSGGLAPPIPQSDAWGMPQAPAQPSSAFSFDDAFGDAPSKSLAPPTLPERRDSGVGAQPDDIEDVKKLCAMGFPRSLVIEALGANGYDFQKTLNVLLQ